MLISILLLFLGLLMPPSPHSTNHLILAENRPFPTATTTIPWTPPRRRRWRRARRASCASSARRKAGPPSDSGTRRLVDAESRETPRGRKCEALKSAHIVQGKLCGLDLVDCFGCSAANPILPGPLQIKPNWHGEIAKNVQKVVTS